MEKLSGRGILKTIFTLLLTFGSTIQFLGGAFLLFPAADIGEFAEILNLPKWAASKQTRSAIRANVRVR